MQFHHKAPFNYGYTALVPRSGAGADMLMEFGIINLRAGTRYENDDPDEERVWLLTRGKARIVWGIEERVIERGNIFDDAPWCLSVSAGVKVSIEAFENSEFCFASTENSRAFTPRLFTPEESEDEYRGKGTMLEASTRIVRTIFDYTNRPESNLVIGEVIGCPGKWSSYPPHHHPQPEIYHYRFLPSQGFGLTAIGNTPYIIKDKDTILIHDGEDHPQVTAPGYAMWYLWVIRHLEGNPYGVQYDAEEHKWVKGPEEKIWRPKGK